MIISYQYDNGTPIEQEKVEQIKKIVENYISEVKKIDYFFIKDKKQTEIYVNTISNKNNEIVIVNHLNGRYEMLGIETDDSRDDYILELIDKTNCFFTKNNLYKLRFELLKYFTTEASYHIIDCFKRASGLVHRDNKKDYLRVQVLSAGNSMFRIEFNGMLEDIINKVYYDKFNYFTELKSLIRLGLYVKGTVKGKLVLVDSGNH